MVHEIISDTLCVKTYGANGRASSLRSSYKKSQWMLKFSTFIAVFVYKWSVTYRECNFTLISAEKKDFCKENFWWNMIQNMELNASCKYFESCQRHPASSFLAQYSDVYGMSITSTLCLFSATGMNQITQHGPRSV